jgi:hypothetical protein
VAVSLRRPALLSALALLALSLWEIARLVSAHAGAPTDEEWRQAAASVQGSFQRGDLIVFAPRWVDPVGRLHLGHLMTVDDAARMDGVRYPRVWEVSIRGAHAPEVAGERAKLELRHGPVLVRLFERSAPAVTWDLRERAKLLEVDFQPRRCVPLRPSLPGGPPARLDVGSVPLGTELAVYAGISDFRSRRENQDAALLRVLVDDVEVAAGRIANSSGWRALPVAVTSPGPHQVVFEATVEPRAGASNGRLDLCLAAEARQP